MYEPNKAKADYQPRKKYKGHDKTVAAALTSYYNDQAGHDNKVAAGLTATANGTATPGPPVDPALMAQKAAANLNVQLGSVWDTYKGGQIDASYGNLDNPAADAATNPYSQAALATKRFNESQAGTTNSYAASGQLYAGSLQNAAEANAGNYLQGLDALRKQKQGEKDALTQGALGRYSQAGADINTDTLASLLKSLGLGS